ncbi:MAG: class I SAM-dependent methyltransferase [Candidatus Eremiobacteraeota bacterium]|nr:class I SAM-dependent methyltransferase [Candidatus Eremiobacteraeota bacterium]
MAELGVFCESWGLGRASAFDYEADRLAREALDRTRVTPGVCSVSGRNDTFILFGANYREDLLAARSGSSSRLRATAAALSWSLHGHAFASVRELCDALAARSARIYMAETSGAFHAAMRRHAGAALTTSEYLGPQYRAGQIVDGRRHEDLEHLSFADASFDVVVTRDVMEHVPDAPAAEAEIVRVLKPGGWYVFTIPFYFTLRHDRIRASLRGDGTVVHAETPEYHSDPLHTDPGVLVYRDFSEFDLRERFAALGCSFEILRLWAPAFGIVGADMIVMAVRKLR